MNLSNLMMRKKWPNSLPFNSCLFRSWWRTSLAASILCRNDDVALCERLRISSCIYGGRRRRIIPKFSFFEEPGRLEEERRLAYVGITRAQKNWPSLMRKAVDYMPKKNAICHHGLSQNYRENVSKKFVYEDSHACDEPSKVGSLSNTSAVENEWKMGQKLNTKIWFRHSD